MPVKLSSAEKIGNLTVLDTEGDEVRIESLWEERPVVIVWIRHYGCTHCRHYAVQLNKAVGEIDELGADVAIIGQATPKHAAHFQRRWAPEIDFYADEDRASYKAAGIGKANTFQLIGPKSALKGARRAASGVGVGRPIGDVSQLGGTMIVAPGGEILWRHISRDASDNPTVEDVTSALTELLA